MSNLHMAIAEKSAFDAMYQANVERLHRLAWRLLGGDAAAAEDVVQVAFLKAFSAHARFRGDARLDTWLFRIVVREAQNHRRWRRVRDAWRARFGGSVEPSPAASPLADPWLQARIAEAMGRLSAGQREAFVLVHLEGFTVRETARLLSRSEGTVKTHLHRALAALRAQLRDLREDAA